MDDQPPTILLIEPDLLLRMAVADRLRAGGYKVIEVMRGEEAFVVLASAVPVDILFADRESFVIPGRPDPEAQAKTLYPHIDVITVSGLPDRAEQVCNLCNTLSLTDPLVANEVLQELSRLMGRRRAP